MDIIPKNIPSIEYIFNLSPNKKNPMSATTNMAKIFTNGYATLIYESAKILVYANINIRKEITDAPIHIIFLSFVYDLMNGIGLAEAITATKNHNILFLSIIYIVHILIPKFVLYYYSYVYS